MKKIIGGLRFDTETATEVASWGNGLGCRDFRHCTETLYRTAKGNYFLHGEGGPMTSWSRPCGDMTAGGEDIRPMTREEAISWCENRELAEDIEDEFGDSIQDA